MVFETGTDVGYQARCCPTSAPEVYSVEVVETLAGQAARLLKDLHYDNVHAGGRRLFRLGRARATTR